MAEQLTLMDLREQYLASLTPRQRERFDRGESVRASGSGQANGYAADPGTGPEGETCGTCASCSRHHGNTRSYLKCWQLIHRWTHGPGTDIRKKSPACELWEPRPEAICVDPKRLSVSPVYTRTDRRHEGRGKARSEIVTVTEYRQVIWRCPTCADVSVRSFSPDETDGFVEQLGADARCGDCK